MLADRTAHGLGFTRALGVVPTHDALERRELHDGLGHEVSLGEKPGTRHIRDPILRESEVEGHLLGEA